MPKVAPRPHRHQRLLLELEKIYLPMLEQHGEDMRSIGNKILIGGEHMRLFFRLEGIRATVRALRNLKTVEEAIKEGQESSAEAVKIWNRRREWQVHYWEQTAFDFIYWTVMRCRR